MKCPVCTTGVVLVMTERQGVEIDHCPQCRGVWLDRGELDKILDLSSSGARGAAGHGNERAVRRGEDFDDDDDDDRRDRSRGGDGNRSGRRRESFLGDLFDF